MIHSGPVLDSSPVLLARSYMMMMKPQGTSGLPDSRQENMDTRVHNAANSKLTVDTVWNLANGILTPSLESGSGFDF